MSMRKLRDEETGWVATEAEWEAAHRGFIDDYIRDINPSLDTFRPIMVEYNLKRVD